MKVETPRGKEAAVRRLPFVPLLAVVALGGFTAACGDDGSGATTTVPTTAESSTTVAPTTVAPTTAVPTTVAPSTVPPTTLPGGLEQLAVWPAADVVFTTPEAAAEDFLAAVFGDGPVVGDFAAGDSRSGEFEVFATAEGTPLANARALLVMRQLGPDNGWFVMAAMSGGATIAAPEAYGEVTAGPLTVEGVGTGFEATVVVQAFRAGDVTEFDREVTMAGNLGELLPYSVTLDLSGAEPGEVVVILVRGGVGLETDPGDFAAVPVLVTG